MSKIFLIGGGWRAEIFTQTYGRFLEAAARSDERRIALIVAEEPDVESHAKFLRFFEAFKTVGLDSSEAFEVIVSDEKFLTKEVLAEIKPTGVFVCGGLTPAYADALCGDKKWLEYLFENEIPYGGFSAGAAVASANPVVGGWRREIKNKTVQIAAENAGEDLDLLDVRKGLGLVNFTVDVHATEWGNLTRLVHAIDAGVSEEGWAIDENTMLEISENKVEIFGAGNAYQIKRQNGGIMIKIHQSAV